MWKSSRKLRRGSAASSSAASEAAPSAPARMRSEKACMSVEARLVQSQPLERGAVEEARAPSLVQAERVDAAAGFLLAEREGVVGAEHHGVDADGVDQVAQRARIVHAGIEVDLAEVLARVARVVHGDKVGAHVEAVLDAPDGVGE